MFWKWLQQWIGEKQLSLKRRENLEETTCAVTLDSFYFFFVGGLVLFCFCCTEDVATVISSLYAVQEPSEALIES